MEYEVVFLCILSGTHIFALFGSLCNGAWTGKADVSFVFFHENLALVLLYFPLYALE